MLKSEPKFSISPGKQGTISKLYHLTFLLNSSSNKLDHVSSITAGFSINTGSNPHQLMVIGFGKCTSSLSHTVVDPSPQILMHNFMWLSKPARPSQHFFTHIMVAWGDLSYSYSTTLLGSRAITFHKGIEKFAALLPSSCGPSTTALLVHELNTKKWPSAHSLLNKVHADYWEGMHPCS